MVAKNFLLSFLLILCFSTFIFAQNDSNKSKSQEIPQEDKTIRIDTELIQLDVIVTDKNGKAVGNLKQEDFEIIEDGKKQAIEIFSFVRAQVRESALDETSKIDKKNNIDIPLIEKSGRTFVILVDDLHISPGNMLNIKKQLLTLTDNQIQDGDRAAVVTTGGGLGFLQQLTDERKVVRKALEKLLGVKQSFSLPGDPAMLTEYQAQKIFEGDTQALDLGVTNYYRNTAIPLPEERVKEIVRSTAKQIVDVVAFQTTRTLQTIRNSILSVKSIPGRKTLILVTDGFLIETREADHLAQMRRIVDSATKSGVVVYSLNSAGLTVSSANDIYNVENQGTFNRGNVGFDPVAGELTASLFGMKAIAQDTGGFSIVNSNDLLGGLENIVAESSSYYLLAYYPENSTKDGKFKEIKINIKGDKKLIVKTRKGYFSGEEKIDPKELERIEKLEAKNKKNVPAVDPERKDLINSLSSVLPVTDIRLKMKADFLGVVGDTKSNSVLSFAINLEDVKLNKSDNKYLNKLSALLIVVGEDGKIVHSSANNVDINFPEAKYEQVSKSWFFYALSLSLKPGFYNVRFALRDPISNRLGSVSGWVEIPNLEKSKMTLSNILLLHTGTKTEQNPETNITATGQAMTIFSEKSSLGFLTYIFNFPKGEKLTAQIQIIKANKPVFTSEEIDVFEKIDSNGRLVYGGSVPLAGLPQGSYNLKITITDSKTKDSASQEQRFTIF
jgi:VWFA-related protein